MQVHPDVACCYNKRENIYEMFLIYNSNISDNYLMEPVIIAIMIIMGINFTLMISLIDVLFTHVTEGDT